MAKKKVSPDTEIEVESDEERKILEKWIVEEQPEMKEVVEEGDRYSRELESLIDMYGLRDKWEDGDIWFTIIPGKG